VLAAEILLQLCGWRCAGCALTASANVIGVLSLITQSSRQHIGSSAHHFAAPGSAGAALAGDTDSYRPPSAAAASWARSTRDLRTVSTSSRPSPGAAAGPLRRAAADGDCRCGLARCGDGEPDADDGECTVCGAAGR